MRQSSTHRQTHHRAKPNCVASTGIIFLSVGLIMIVWGVTSSSGEIVFINNPLLIAGVAFFGSGFFTVFVVSVMQQITRNDHSSAPSDTVEEPSEGHDSPAFEVEVDEPPSYGECFVIQASTSSDTFPSPELLKTLKSINDLPSYQELFGEKGDSSGKPV